MPTLRPIQSLLSNALLPQVSISFPEPHSDLDIAQTSQSPRLTISTSDFQTEICGQVTHDVSARSQ